MYSRPSLTAVISGEVSSVDQIHIFPSKFLRDAGVTVFPSYRVNEINFPNKIVHARSVGATGGNEQRHYGFNNIILATGSIPYVPKVGSDQLKGVFTIRKFREAKLLSEFSSEGLVAHVIGAGFVGLEVAEALAKRGIKVSLVVRSRILRLLVEEDLSERLTRRLEGHGVQARLGCCFEGVQGDRKVKAVIIDGQRHRSDMVVYATGVSPNVRLATETGIEVSTNGAITIDNRMQTSLKGVYTAGDCCETLDFVSECKTYRPIGSVAADEGKIAGVNAVEGAEESRGTIRQQYNKLFGTGVVSMGLSSEEAHSLGLKAKSFTMRVKSLQSEPFSLRKRENIMKMVVEQGSDRIIGWQSIGTREASFLSHYMFDCILNHRGISEVAESGLKFDLQVE
ncbi:MAG: FAD-dependent oxidoreductase [Candidatus Bathyarchaeota archaeon]|nr:MAG: FAD-dependent oxidoreductase [Candidatus Bathyarchaeota archaeon]